MAGSLTLSQVEIPITAATQKKLRALVALSEDTFASVERQLADSISDQLTEVLDMVITQKCAELLGIEAPEQVNYTVSFPVEASPEIAPAQARPKSFAEAEKQAAGQRSEEVEEAFAGFEEVSDEISGHELSGDPDAQENKSLAEQAEEEDELIKQTITNPKTKNTFNDPEAFVDAAFGSSGKDPDYDEMPTVRHSFGGAGSYSNGARSATRSFESRVRKGGGARISPHTGEED